MVSYDMALTSLTEELGELPLTESTICSVHKKRTAESLRNLRLWHRKQGNIGTRRSIFGKDS